jgi:hypothetical protein
MLKASAQKASAVGATVSLVLAAAAASFLLFAPCTYRGVRATEEVGVGGGSSHQEEFCASLIEANGVGVVIPVAIPVALAAIGALSSMVGIRAAVSRVGVRMLVLRLGMRTVVWISAVLSLLFSVATGFSIGLFYMPASLGLLVAAILQHAGTGEAVGERA